MEKMKIWVETKMSKIIYLEIIKTKNKNCQELK